VAYSATFCHFLEPLQVVLVKPQRDLLCARRSNLDIKILEVFVKLFDAVTTPELTLRTIALEAR
jgi:hypothetical protein